VCTAQCREALCVCTAQCSEVLGVYCIVKRGTVCVLYREERHVLCKAQ